MSEPERLANSMMEKLERRTLGTLGNRNSCFINQDVGTSIIIWHHSLTCFVIKSCFGLPNNPIGGWHWTVFPPQVWCICHNPESRQTHSLHNNWYCSSFLKGEDEQRIVSGSSGVTHAHTRASTQSSSRMTNTRRQAPRVQTHVTKAARPYQKAGLRGSPGLPRIPGSRKYAWEGGQRRPNTEYQPSPSNDKHKSRHSAFRDFKCYVLNPVSDLLGKTRQTGTFYKEQKTSVGRQRKRE